MADDVRQGAAPEFTYCETFSQRVAFDHAAMALALSVDEAWVLQGSDVDLDVPIRHEQTVLQGPHIEVLDSGLIARVDRDEDVAARWPLLASNGELAAIHAASLVVVALGYSPQVPPIGTFSVSRGHGPPFSESEVANVVEFARLMAGMLLARWQAVRDVDRLEGLIHDYRHLAAGMLASYLGVRPQSAMAIMRARAFSEGRTLTDLSADIVTSLGTSAVRS